MRERILRQRGLCTHMDMMIIVAAISILAAILVPNFLKARRAGLDNAMKQEAAVLAGRINHLQALAPDWRLVPAAPARAHMGALPQWECELIYEFRRGARAYEGGGRTKAHRFEIEGLRLYDLTRDEVNMGLHINFYMPWKKEIHYIGSVVLNERGAPVVVSAGGLEGRAEPLDASIVFCNNFKKCRVTINEGGAVAEKE